MIAALVDHLWQSTLFALAAGLLTLPLRGAGAGVRYGLWLAASVKFLVPFALLAAVGSLVVAPLHLAATPPPHSFAVIAPMVEPMTSASILAAPAALPVVPQTAIGRPFDLAPVLLGVWALGLAGVLLLWAVRWGRVRAALLAASPMDLAAPVPVLSSPTLFEPGVVGVRRPVLVLPEGIAERLSLAELNAILAHELCHVRRRDNLTGAIHMLVQALFWFHPLVWWLGGRLVDERERACDEAVIRAGHDRDTYARGILETCRLYLQSPLVCVAGASGSSLEDRVVAIMTSPLCKPLPLTAKALLGMAGALALASPVAAGILAAPPIQMAQPAAAPIAPAAAPRAAAVATPAEAAAPAAAAQPPEPPKPIVLAQASAAPSPAAAPANPSPEEVARLLAEQQQPRQVAPFDPAHFDRYVGYYQLNPGAVFHITREGGKFFTQLTGQPAVEVYPESETKFFATVVAAQVSFVVDSQGVVTALVLHQNGRELPAPRMDEAQAKASTAALAQRLVSNTPAPGTQEFLRRYLASQQAGAPDYSQMAPGLAQAARAQQDRLTSDLKIWGPVQSIQFNGVMPQGMDRYIVTFKNAAFPILVGPPGPDGKFEGLLLMPQPGNPPSPEAAARMAGNRPSPGTEAYLREYLVSASKGQPDYSGMGPGLAAAARAQWPTRGPVILARGALKSLTFLRVSPEGYDVYDAVYEHAEVLWTVAPLGPEGKESYASGVPLFENRPG